MLLGLSRATAKANPPSRKYGVYVAYDSYGVLAPGTLLATTSSRIVPRRFTVGTTEAVLIDPVASDPTEKMQLTLTDGFEPFLSEYWGIDIKLAGETAYVDSEFFPPYYDPRFDDCIAILDFRHDGLMAELGMPVIEMGTLTDTYPEWLHKPGVFFYDTLIDFIYEIRQIG